MNNSLLIETCLLSRGIKSITDEELYNCWPRELNSITWIERGNIVVGNIKEFLEFRNSNLSNHRINYKTLPEALKHHLSGSLTASGTMLSCEILGAKIAVSCGLGGFVNPNGESGNDIEALQSIDIPLFATSFKDMFDINYSINYLTKHDVPVLGFNTNTCSGYLLNNKETKINVYNHECLIKKGLILNPIKPDLRLKDNSLLNTCINAGMEAEKHGQSFHIAVNNAFDKHTNGYSSKIQLDSLIQNSLFAKALII